MEHFQVVLNFAEQEAGKPKDAPLKKTRAHGLRMKLQTREPDETEWEEGIESEAKAKISGLKSREESPPSESEAKAQDNCVEFDEEIKVEALVCNDVQEMKERQIDQMSLVGGQPGLRHATFDRAIRRCMDRVSGDELVFHQGDVMYDPLAAQADGGTLFYIVTGSATWEDPLVCAHFLFLVHLLISVWCVLHFS